MSIVLADITSLDLLAPLAQNPMAVYLAGLAPGSRRAMHQALRVVAALDGDLSAEAFPWHQLRYQHTQAIRAKLAERYAPAAANKILSALRGVLKQAWRLGYMTAEDYARAYDIGTIKGSLLPKGRALLAGEIRTLFASCDASTSNGARDAALLAVLYGAGLRRSEIVALQDTDYDAAAGSLRVLGKGNKQRLVQLPKGSQSALQAWLQHRGDTPGALFVAVNKGGRVILQNVTAQSVMEALQRLANKAGVSAFSPHDLRRTFVGDLLDAGADISTVQQLAGHANVSTTQRYDRRGEASKRKAVDLLHVPYGV